MTAKQLLASNSFIQYPKYLGYYIGVNEAVLISALCDKDSWCEYNVEDYDGWFYYIRDEIEMDTGLSERQQRTAMTNLEKMNLIVSKRQGIPAKVYYNIVNDALENVLNVAYNAHKELKIQMLQNATSCPNKTVTTCTSENDNSTINNNINIINNITTKAPEPALSPKTSSRRNFRKEHEQLTDELASGKVIDEEKREKKKKTNFEKCLDELSSRNFSDDVKELLEQHLQWSYNSRDAKRIKDRSSYKSKLDFLEQKQKQGYNLKDIVQQSIDRGWHAFYEFYGHGAVKNQNEPLADRVVMNNPEEARKVLEQLRADPNRKVY